MININSYHLKTKKKLQEHNKQWFNNKSPEGQEEIRIKARKYHKNRYHNWMVKV